MNLIELLEVNNLTVSTAESITAGLIASNICSIPGASKCFKGGVVSYTKEAKCALLGLEMEAIDKFGVYSNETVISMAEGVKRLTKSDVAISSSGVAGPSSDEGVEAGTVYFCIIIRDKRYTYEKEFDGSRNEVREKAARFIVEQLNRLLVN